jgi:nucleoside 2-deoxyribosyltransferase
MNIYLASSWKNAKEVNMTAKLLRIEGFAVDAFCDSSGGRFVFSFNELPGSGYRHNARTILGEPLVQMAFAEDKKWLDWADAVILILPSGKSAHLEAGYAVGKGKFLIIYQPEGLPLGEFDVMYGFANLITSSITEAITFLDRQLPQEGA